VVDFYQAAMTCRQARAVAQNLRLQCDDWWKLWLNVANFAKSEFRCLEELCIASTRSELIN
jgi:hypothetical protein